MAAAGAGPGPGPGAGSSAGAGASNPRKFSEKIALQKQRQAEETAAFEEVMMEICNTRVSAARPGGGRCGEGGRRAVLSPPPRGNPGTRPPPTPHSPPPREHVGFWGGAALGGRRCSEGTQAARGAVTPFIPGTHIDPH